MTGTATPGHPAAAGTRAPVTGPTWFPYLMRRLAEHPANVLFVLRGAFR